MAKNKSINDWHGCYWAAAIFLPIFIYIALMSYFTPLMLLDFFVLDFKKPDGNIFFATAEAWDFFKKSYFSVSGRLHYFIKGFFLFSFYRTPFEENFSQTILAILNGLVFVAFLVNLFFLAFARKPIFHDKNDRIKLFIIFLLMMTILAEKGETIFHLSNRGNYLWGATLLSSFAIFFRLAFAHDGFLRFHRQPIKHFLFIATMMPLAIFAGMVDYVGALIVLGLLLFGFFYKIYIARKKLPLWCYIVFVFFVIGVIILYIAPGNYNRYDSSLSASYHELSIFGKILVHPLKGLHIFLHETFFLPLILLPVFFHWQKNIIVPKKKLGKGFGKIFSNRFINKMQKDKKFGMAVIYLLSAFGFVILMGVFPENISRVWFSGTCIFLLACMLVIDFIFFSKNKQKLLQKNIVKKSIFLASSFLLTIYLSFILIHTIGFYHEFENRMQTIKAQKEAGKDIITIKPYSDKYVRSRFGVDGYGFWNRQVLTDGWENASIANYYGVKKIVLDRK